MPPFDIEQLKEQYRLKIVKFTEQLEKDIKKHDIGNDYILQDVYDYIVRDNQRKILNQITNHINNKRKRTKQKTLTKNNSVKINYSQANQ